jgi:hypothetical protein
MPKEDPSEFIKLQTEGHFRIFTRQIAPRALREYLLSSLMLKDLV